MPDESNTPEVAPETVTESAPVEEVAADLEKAVDEAIAENLAE